MNESERGDRTRIALGLIANLPDYTVDANLREICCLAERAGRMKCDLFATEEAALTLFTGGASVRVPGAETRKVAALARKHRMYIVLGLHERRDRTTRHNSQVIFDRRGRIVGVYRKVQLTNGEIAGGCVPGDEIPLYDTDFGRLGIVICYDSQFPEVSRAMAVKGADIILFPHVGGAVGDDLVGRSIAYENTIWTATVGRTYCCICDPRGRTVAETRRTDDLLVVDCAVRRRMLSTNPVTGILDWRTHQWLERRPDLYHEVTGPPVTVESDMWPLYMGNRLEAGAQELRFKLLNRSTKRQRGKARVLLPAPMYILTDEYVGHFVDQDFGGEDWRPRPAEISFSLDSGRTREHRVRFRVPADAEGYRISRILLLHCGGGAAEEATQIIRTTR